MKRALVFLLATAVCLCATTSGYGQKHQHNPAAFACDSALFMQDDFEHQPVIPSPDGKKVIRLTRNYQFQLTVDGKVTAQFKLPDVETDIEVGWSPDSTQFFISYSDSGATGAFHVYLYRLSGHNLLKSKLPAEIAVNFKAKHWCPTRGNNLYFLGWSRDSSIAFLVAEVYPTSDCGTEMGLFRGYAVDTLNQTIIRTFDGQRTEAIEKQCRAAGTLALPAER